MAEGAHTENTMTDKFDLLVTGLFLLAAGAVCFCFPHRIQQADIKLRERAFRSARWLKDYPDMAKGPEYIFFVKYGGFALLVLSIVFLAQFVSLLFGYDAFLGMKVAALAH